MRVLGRAVRGWIAVALVVVGCGRIDYEVRGPAPDAAIPSDGSTADAAPGLGSCPAGEVCELTCAAGYGCSFQCGANATCTATCRGDCEIVCGANATCTLTCDSGTQTCGGGGCVQSCP